MAHETLRYGIIGTGMMGCEHIRNLALLPGVEVVAIADSDADEPQLGSRRRRAATSRSTRTTASCCAARRVDAVVVATPNFTHHDVLRAVFETRLHVLVEKPLCTEIEQCHARRRGGRAASGRRLGRHGVPLHAAGRAAGGGGARRRRRAAGDAGDPRAPLPVPEEGRRLEPLQPQHRRHAGREVLPLLRPDERDRAPAATARLRVRRRRREPPGRALRRRAARHPRQRLRHRRLRERRARAARPVHVRRELDERDGDRRDRRPRQGRGLRARRTGSS